MAFNEHNQQLVNAIASVITDSDILHQVVHGDENLVIPVDSGNVRSLLNILNLESAIEHTLNNGTSQFGILTENGIVTSNVDVDVTGDVTASGEMEAATLNILTSALIAALTVSGALNTDTLTATGAIAGDSVSATNDVSGDTATIATSATVAGSPVLTQADEGSGNGIDSDTVDGLEATQFLRSDIADTVEAILTFIANPIINPSTGQANIEIKSEDSDAVIKVRAVNPASGNPKFEFYRDDTGIPVMTVEATANDELTITGVDDEKFKLGTSKILTETNFPAATQASQEIGTATGEIVTPANQKFNRSALKAWVNFNGTGTVAIRDSENVSSITDHGTGDYTVNFTNNMADTNYLVQITCSHATDDADASFGYMERTGQAVGSVRIHTQEESVTYSNPEHVFVAIIGDLA